MRTIPHSALVLARSPRFLLAAVLAALLVAIAVVTASWHPRQVAAEDAVSARIETVEELPSAKPARFGEPRDPLSIEEIGYAEALASAALPEGAETLAGTPGAELLSIDLASMDPDEKDRPVAVTYFDYAADEVVEVVVELYSGAVQGTETAAGVQPPPSPSETFAATEILIGSSQAKKLGTEYTAMTGYEITAEDLIVTGGSYYDSDVTRADDDCGQDRCVELQLQEPSGTYLTTADFVVNLSTGEVIRLATRDMQSTLGGN